MANQRRRLERRVKFNGDSESNRAFVLSDARVLSIVENEDGDMADGWNTVCDELGLCRSMIRERYLEIKSRRVQLLDPYSSKSGSDKWRETYSKPVDLKLKDNKPRFAEPRDDAKWHGRTYTDAYIRSNHIDQYYQEVHDIYAIMAKYGFEITDKAILECANATAHSLEAAKYIAKFVCKRRNNPVFIRTFEKGPCNE